MIEFIQAIESAGLAPPGDGFTANGEIFRYPDNGKNRSGKPLYCCLYDHGDFYAGFFGDWRTDYYQTWISRNESELTPDQRRQYRDRIEKGKTESDRIRKAEAEQAAIEARKIWEQAKSADPNHPYLLKKRVKPHGIRQDGNVLLIPVMDPAGNIKSIQRIFPDGKKRFLKNGATMGGFFRIPGDDATIYICEGFATGATIHEISGATVYIAFNAGNLLPAARAIKRAMI